MINIIQHTGVYDDVTGMECTSLDCFIGFMTQYEQYSSELKEGGISTLLEYVSPYYIEHAYNVANDILKDESSNEKMNSMANKVLGYINGIVSVIETIKIEDDYHRELKNKMIIALILIGVME